MNTSATSDRRAPPEQARWSDAAPRAALIGLLCAAALLLAGCVNSTVKRVNETQAAHAEQELPEVELTEVHIARFDPGYTKPVDEDSGIFPEVRDAEAVFIPRQLRETLHRTGYWGPVRVVPEPLVGSELSITGEILQSNGLELEIRVEALDATGRTWLAKTYHEEAAKLSYTDADPAVNDPFQDLYNRVANDLLEARRELSTAELLEIRRVATLRFGNDFAPYAFGDYLKNTKSGYAVRAMPAEGDPNLERIERIRERDYRLIDALDRHYLLFGEDIQRPYNEWRAASYREAKNLEELQSQSLTRLLAGAAAVVGGLAGLGNANSNVEAVAAQSAIVGGAYLFKSGLDKRSESKIHRESLKELGKSLSRDVEPRVVELEGKTVTLTGSAEAQYREWRELLRELYATETGFQPSAGEADRPARDAP